MVTGNFERYQEGEMKIYLVENGQWKLFDNPIQGEFTKRNIEIGNSVEIGDSAKIGNYA